VEADACRPLTHISGAAMSSVIQSFPNQVALIQSGSRYADGHSTPSSA